MDLESSGPIYTFNELRDQLCGNAKFGFDVINIYLFGICFMCEKSKQDWITRIVDLEGIDFGRHPKQWKNCCQSILISMVFAISRGLLVLMQLTIKPNARINKLTYSGNFSAVYAKVNELMDFLSFK